MESKSSRTLTDALKARALELGFARAGVARADVLVEEGRRLTEWLREDRHGEMGYMADTSEVRADPRHEGMLPTARSILVLATAYQRVEMPDGPAPGRVARYAQGRDYHNVLYRRARKLARLLREAGHDVRVGVDTLPIFERAWARRAGLGFIGKNDCLIIPGLGSHVLLSCLVTSAELEPDSPIKERCGACTRCLDACPTEAFVGARQLDARRCISYLTIEQRGSIDEKLRPQLGPWIFGCDVCQDVCPFNASGPSAQLDTSAFATDPRWKSRDASALLDMDEAEFATYAQGSPIKRPGRSGMARNAAVVLGNQGEVRHLPQLERAAQSHDDAVVRESAAWAVRQIKARFGKE